MTYLWIFSACYVVAAFFVLSNFLRKNAIAAARLSENSASPHVKNFQRMMWRQSIFFLAWATFVFGSAGGGVISLIYWLVS